MYLSRLQFKTAKPLYETHRTIMRGFDNNLQNERVLFRAERDIIIVQSLQRPDWSRLGACLVSQSVTQKTLRFETGQNLVFNLLANPTVKHNGKRHGLYLETEQRRWLDRKALAGGFEIRSVDVLQRGVARVRKKSHSMLLLAVQFRGLLSVEKSDRLRASVFSGVGSGKGFGFGLLLVSGVNAE